MTEGLDSCRHFGPSIIDRRTLAQNPHLSETFLKGCGLSDWEIESAKLHREDLKIGDRIRPAIHDAIRLHDKLLLILSEHSVGSRWVEDEVERALDRENAEDSTILFPIRLDDAVMNVDAGWASSIKRTRHIGDFRAWNDPEKYQVAFDRLLRDLRASQ